ncbi:Fur family transcriptional regulator [Clostridium botulinum]|uniref:Transcriptional repressor n=1 Tax=Clostridium botulinum TaxID=1491 RepID=A0A6G4EIK2_CLOBO|nr:transcriptional repressor [Clostridium botulinum]APH19026.1 ferric uptake regulator family protein [Clostridium botulinum]AUM92319.1 transcriptional repressor [Clostridium botulinum]NFB12458.1 transcriptional repressor [Clostridium botulinum]NFH58401.1 transcriptional repressor [Clostridium botulinum]NFH63010.1 transcriptional repressor [Clostridium botulinum]
MSKELEFYKHIFNSNNIRLTTRGIIILKIFLNHKDDHLTVNEIYCLGKETYPSISLATVYRTIKTLLKLDLLDHLSLEDGGNRYKLFVNKNINLKAYNKHHSHLICLNCKKIIDCHYNFIDTIKTEINKNCLFKITGFEMKFYGYCEKCYIKKVK